MPEGAEHRPSHWRRNSRSANAIRTWCSACRAPRWTENSQLGEEYKVGDLVDFAAPGGGRFAGVLRELNDEDALFDFNHPLAGQTLKFEVHIIGIF